MGLTIEVTGEAKNQAQAYNQVKWASIRERVLRRDKYQCLRCGDMTQLSVHHIKSRIDGGKDTMRNLETLCYSCQ